MKRIVAVAACSLLAVPLMSVSAEAAPKPKKFASCAALNAVFPHGVSANEAAASAIERGRFYRPDVSKTTYNINLRLDTAKKGTACEVALPVVTPGPASGVSTVASGADRIDIKWYAPSNDGGSPITSYKVTSTGGNVTVIGTNAVINGLTAGTSYTFTVVAVNAVGESAPATLTASTTSAPVAATVTTSGPMAKCKDGTYSYSKTHQGTCSSHGGVETFYR